MSNSFFLLQHKSTVLCRNGGVLANQCKKLHARLALLSEDDVLVLNPVAHLTSTLFGEHQAVQGCLQLSGLGLPRLVNIIELVHDPSTPRIRKVIDESLTKITNFTSIKSVVLIIPYEMLLNSPLTSSVYLHS